MFPPPPPYWHLCHDWCTLEAALFDFVPRLFSKYNKESDKSAACMFSPPSCRACKTRACVAIRATRATVQSPHVIYKVLLPPPPLDPLPSISSAIITLAGILSLRGPARIDGAALTYSFSTTDFKWEAPKRRITLAACPDAGVATLVSLWSKTKVPMCSCMQTYRMLE